MHRPNYGPVLNLARIISALVLLFCLGSCGKQEFSATEPTPPSAPLNADGWIQDDSYYEKTVHYGTTRFDRLREAHGALDSRDDENIRRLNTGNNKPSESIKYGTVKVIIPFQKKTGGTEGMSVFELNHDIGWAQFFGGISSNELVVFVHGYNTSFTDAAIRAAQMAHDTNFQGEPVLYSWPSTTSLVDYKGDKDRAKENFTSLARFLLKLAEESDHEINIIAHSMGGYILVHALEKIDEWKEAGEFSVEAICNRRDGRLFDQVILASPDISITNFEEIITSHDITKYSSRMTLYSTHNDKVLTASRLVNIFLEGSGEARLGSSAKAFEVVTGVDTIDARQEIPLQFFGHSFYAKHLTLVSDIHSILNYGVKPDERMLQKVRDHKNQELWFIREAEEK